MSDIVIPKNYKSQLNLYETQVAIKTVKDFFQGLLAERLHLLRVSAPLFVDPTSGLNDNLNGVERPVNFHIAAQGDREAEIVQSLAKWKRYALQKYGFQPGEGLYTDMSAIRQDEETDNIHSIYVDQWDWEKIITKEERNLETLKETVRTVYTLQQKVSEANALLAGLESDINAYKSVYDQYEQQQKNVQSQIDKQVEELRRQEEANKNNNPGYDPGKANGSTGTMMWPCPSCHYITSPFGWRYHPIYQTQKYHSGVDIGASYGATIVAADGGTIITAGSVSGYGNCVVINHGNGITTLYGHMSSIAVSVGQKVSKGQTIGYVGSTGNSTGPHLHWEVTVNGVRQNPLNYAS